MKFGKIKLRRCKNCKYYENIGNLHFCNNSKIYKYYGLKVLHSIPLFCFRKEKTNGGRK